MNKKLLTKIATSIRSLSMDGVQAANSGHPGLPLGMADVAAVLWAEFLKHNPKNPTWFDRDRFILSAGHGSMLHYSLLHLFGYDLPLQELKDFRQWKSKTPGHPEYHLTAGIETTTGPLGQGISNGVGMALAEKSLAARYNRGTSKVVNHYTYIIASDGDLEEGISHESCSFAGHNQLEKLIVLYDDNSISIDGDTALSFSEDIPKRFAAYGWHCQQIDGHDIDAIRSAIKEAKKSDKPSLIACRTLIGYGSPNKQGKASAHGAPLGPDEVRLTKENLGIPPDEFFYIHPEVEELKSKWHADGLAQESKWKQRMAKFREKYSKEALAFRKCLNLQLSKSALKTPSFKAGKLATRSASGAVLDHLAPRIPALIGGSADLTPSNNTFPKSESAFGVENPEGRYIHYGVREHGMGAIMNGMALHGGVIPYAGTFFVFSDYMRPSVRLAALMGLRVIYVWTHDSIGLGEDGPTHQPIEQLASLRCMPNLSLIRPMDANEASLAWQMALEREGGPTGLLLTRQKLPIYDRKKEGLNGAEGARKGGYILSDAKNYQAVIISSGSEVEIALDAKKILEDQSVAVRVVSMPSTDVFDQQTKAYREKVLPSASKRLVVEAGATLTWHKYLGEDGEIMGLDHFGASGPYEKVYKGFGLTAGKVANRVKRMLKS
ncbi:MAG: transketolase [Saprospiraceae bacterium]|nr:transketolase [Saprospiraceae bacterium]